MSESDLSSRLVDVVRRAGKVAPTVIITPGSRLVEDLGIDSLDLVAVFLAVQDELGVVVEDDDVPELKTLGDVAAYVAARSENLAA